MQEQGVGMSSGGDDKINMNDPLASHSKTEFITAASLGRSGWKYAVGAFFLLIAAWLVGNLVYYAMESSILAKFDSNASVYILQLAFLCSTTALLWLGMFIVARFVLRRSVGTFVFSSKNIDLRLLVLGVVVFFLARAIDLLVLLMIGAKVGVPVVRRPDFAVSRVFFIYSSIYIFVLIFQSAIEEITARGFAMQSIFSVVKNRLVAATLTSILFVALHPGSSIVFASTMFAASMWMAAFCFVSDGLEMSIGFHIGNNVGAFLASVFFGGSYLNITAPAGSEWSLFVLYVLAAAVTFSVASLRRDRWRDA